MPFPLAHPAAVLPFRRYCPRFLSFPALIVGSLSPDAGYFFSQFQVDDFSHRLAGSIGFCLPVGLLTLLVLYGVGSRIVMALPNPWRRIFSPLCQQPRGSPLAVVLSVILGAVMHILWDSFTHKEGWLAQHLSILQFPVARITNRQVRICHLIWYGSTFGGVTWLVLAFQHWLQVTILFAAPATFRVKLRNAFVFAALVLPIAAAHHLFHLTVGNYLVAVISVLLVIGFVFWAAKQPTELV